MCLLALAYGPLGHLFEIDILFSFILIPPIHSIYIPIPVYSSDSPALFLAGLFPL